MKSRYLLALLLKNKFEKKKMATELVYLENCYSYNEKEIEKIIKDSLKYLKISLPSGKTILLKPNVLGSYEPNKYVTTHPAIVKAITNILLKKNNRIIIGDSSGLRIHNGTNEALKTSGIKALERKNVNVISFDEAKSDPYKIKSNKSINKINITRLIKEADYIINIPKLKSHQFTIYTGAVKNFFGCVPGGIKQYCHVIAPNPKDFSNLLLDIYEIIKPKILLNIMDGIIGIDGPGPGPSGKVKKAGIIAVSRDAIALDIICSGLITKGSSSILTNKLGLKRKLFNKEIKTNKKLKPVYYKLPMYIPLPSFLYSYFASFSYSKPEISATKCKKCMFCISVCPTKAISKHEILKINKDKCIYCYCCHENCPHKAIELKDNLILKIYKKLNK